jgi:hypothetical protein
VTCSRVNATATCGTGICSIGSCNSGYGNCDGLDPNGCETNTNTTATHCGACGQACSSNNVPNPTCGSGMCNGACASGFGDCNGNKLTDGCETSLTTITNCGSCGNSCAAPPNATPTCASSVCAYVCGTGFADCDGSADCECRTSAGFACVLNACNCLNGATCTNGGTCGGDGRCVCSGTNCARGQICVGPATCGSP